MVPSLLTRRPAVPDPQTWTPEGTSVIRRYGALKDAIVLVYTADAETLHPRYAVACLGCTYRESLNGAGWLSEQDAGLDANGHASTCRAMPSGVPVRPDDDAADTLIRAQVENNRVTTKARALHLADVLGVRVDLQRSTDWIKQALHRLAHAEPGLLTATPASADGGTHFTVQPYPVG
jgi:hypothetical protein